MEHVLKIRGIIPFPESELGESYRQGYEDREDMVEFTLSLMTKFKNVGWVDTKKINAEYLPEIDLGYIEHLIPSVDWHSGKTLPNGNYSKSFVCGNEHVRLSIEDGVCWWFSGNAPSRPDRTVFWLSKRTGKKIYDVLIGYYKWLYKLKTAREVVMETAREWLKCIRDMDTETSKESGTIIECADVTEEDIVDDLGMGCFESDPPIDPVAWRPESILVHMNEKYKRNKQRLHFEYVKNLNQGTEGWVKRSYGRGKFEYWTKSCCKGISDAIAWLKSRKLDRAINRPHKNGWAIDPYKGSVVYVANYTLSGRARRDNVRGCSVNTVGILHRIAPKSEHDSGKKLFENGTKPIPFLLDNLQLSDKVLVVCEGVPDAAFVQNGIAVNNWKPTTSYAKPIIDYFQQKKGMRVVYISDNWTVGDKGGLKHLRWLQQHSPETEILDWSLLHTKCKDIGEYVAAQVDAGDARFVRGEGKEVEYLMPRELILECVRPAKDIEWSGTPDGYAINFAELAM